MATETEYDAAVQTLNRIDAMKELVAKQAVELLALVSEEVWVSLKDGERFVQFSQENLDDLVFKTKLDALEIVQEYEAADEMKANLSARPH